MTAVRTQVRDAVIALLQPLKTAGTVAVVRKYAGELGGDEADDVMRALNGCAPGVLVAVEQGAYRGVDVRRRKYRRDLAIVLYLVSVSQANPEARDEQLAEVEDAILALLSGANPTIGTGETVVPHGVLVPQAEEVMVHDATVCIWRQRWQITVDAALAETPAQNVAQVVGSLNAASEDDNAGDPLVQVTNLITT